jgi:hypothetical protein
MDGLNHFFFFFPWAKKKPVAATEDEQNEPSHPSNGPVEIVVLSIKHDDFPYSYVNVYQRVFPIFP